MKLGAPKELLNCYNSLINAINEAGGSIGLDPDMPLYELIDIAGRNNIKFVYSGPTKDKEESIKPRPTIALCKTEIQSGISRQQWAESLIRQLPKGHDDRNSWLLNYGISDDAYKLREGYVYPYTWNEETCSWNKKE